MEHKQIDTKTRKVEPLGIEGLKEKARQLQTKAQELKAKVQANTDRITAKRIRLADQPILEIEAFRPDFEDLRNEVGLFLKMAKPHEKLLGNLQSLDSLKLALGHWGKWYGTDFSFYQYLGQSTIVDNLEYVSQHPI